MTPQSLLTSRQRLPKPSNRDRIIWRLEKSGVSADEITQRLRLTDDEYQLARLRMLAYTASISNDVVALANNEELLAVARGGGVREAINGALKADRILVSSQGVVLNPTTNEPITEPDHAMRLEGVRTYSRLLKDNTPTGPAVQVNTAINNSNSQVNVIGGGRSFEARRRAAAERRGVVPVAEAEELPEDEIEDESEVLDGEFVGVRLDDPDEIDSTEDDEEE
jgi:hypothetical protein